MFVDLNNARFTDDYKDYLFSLIPEIIRTVKKFKCDVNNNVYKLDRISNTVTFKRILNNKGEVYTVSVNSLYSIYRTCRSLRTGKI